RRELNLALKDERCDVAQVFVLERRGTGNGKAVYESVCGLTSLPPALASPAQLLAYVQHRWHIENRCHWRRDAMFGEDAYTVRPPRVATILALLDHYQVSNARMAMRSRTSRASACLAHS